MDILDKIRTQVRLNQFRFTQHAQQEMAEEAIGLEEILKVLKTGRILEDYPEHRRGACCLMTGVTQVGRVIHVVCTAAQPVVIIITVYEPKPPKWKTATERG